MAIPKKITNFLDKNKQVCFGGRRQNKLKYEIIKHKTVYTAFDKATTLRVAPKIIGKTLLVKLDKNPVLVLIPANKNLDKQKLKKIAKAKSIDFIKEAWMKKNLKGIKIGAIPPFGNLWPARQRVRPACQSLALAGRSQAKSGGKLQTFIDRGLLQNPKIIINSGDYNFSIKISPAIFKKTTPDLVIGNFSQAKK